MKEADTSVITVLNDLFAPMTKKRVKELGIGGEEETKYVGRLSQEVEGCDQSSKVALGEPHCSFVAWIWMLSGFERVRLLCSIREPQTT